ncbi:ABC transporter ATP-binding protein [Streptococcus caprae]|uniref:ABC transporter ATP-binding protein n=1 Tax=Streptococcus caprae TaxID=1640501 RepID=A0ABV8CXL5_9STRE
MKKTIIETRGLTKEFKTERSVDNLSISVQEGEIYGFLGPNGAGKSTTLKMLLGLLQPTVGSIKLFGQTLDGNHQSLLKNVGSLIEEPSYYANLTGYENLKLVQRLLGLPEENIDKVLDIVNLTPHKKKLVKQYSLGMKQRLGIALAILKFPKLLILDEPTNGLDPAGIQEIRELIKSLPQKYGMTVIISSHLLSEIEQMATTVGIIHHGKLLFEGALSELEDEERYLIRTNDDRQASFLLMEAGFQLELSQDILLTHADKVMVAKAVKDLVNSGFAIYQVQPIRKSLEDTFLEMTTGKGV